MWQTTKQEQPITEKKLNVTFTIEKNYTNNSKLHKKICVNTQILLKVFVDMLQSKI